MRRPYQVSSFAYIQSFETGSRRLFDRFTSRLSGLFPYLSTPLSSHRHILTQKNDPPLFRPRRPIAVCRDTRKPTPYTKEQSPYCCEQSKRSKGRGFRGHLDRISLRVVPSPSFSLRPRVDPPNLTCYADFPLVPLATRSYVSSLQTLSCARTGMRGHRNSTRQGMRSKRCPLHPDHAQRAFISKIPRRLPADLFLSALPTTSHAPLDGRPGNENKRTQC